MDPGERITGTRDEHYNLISVLYHALHGAENCDIYAIDAEATGRDELALFFREAQVMQMDLADQAKGLLGIRSALPEVGIVPEAGIVPEEDVILEEDVVLEEIGDVTPGTTVPPDLDVPPETAPLEEVPPDTAPVDVRGRVTPEVGLPPEGRDLPGTAPIEDLPPDRMAPPADIPPETTPGDVPPTTGVPPAAGIPPTEPDVLPEPDILPKDEVAPDTAPIEDVRPRTADVQREPQVRADEVSVTTEPLTADLPPVEEPPEVAERSAEDREYFTNLIRESGRRSRGGF